MKKQLKKETQETPEPEPETETGTGMNRNRPNRAPDSSRFTVNRTELEPENTIFNKKIQF